MMNRLGRIKLFTKIFWIFFAASALPLLIIVVTSYYQFSRSLNQHIQNKLIAISDGRQDLVENSLINMLRLAVEKSKSPTLVTAFEKLDAAFKRPGIKSEEIKLIVSEYDGAFLRYLDANDYLYDMLFISAERNVIYSMTDKSVLGKNLNDLFLKKTALPEAVASADMFLNASVSDYSFYPPSNRPALFIATPVFSKNRWLGTLALQIDPQMMYNFAENYVGLPKTGDITFGKRAGNELVFTTPTRFNADAALNYSAKFGSGSAVPMQKALNGESGIGIATDYRGKQVLARWQYIPLLRWGMVIKVDEASVFQPIYQLRNLYIIIFFLLTLLLFAISYRVSLSISAPIEIVRSGLRIIGSGFLDHKIDIKRGDEIGELADEVNKMAGQLKGVQEKLVRSEKLAGLGKLAGMVSHELRNPLGAIRNSVYFLKMRLGGATGDEKVKKHLNILDEEVEASDRIITDTLTFGRIEEPKLVPTDINMVIQGVLGSVKIPDNIESVSELSGDVPPILLDAVQVKRVFSNLITNAIQAMPGGGKLTLSSRMVCDSSTNDKYVAVTVKDTGEGISPENLKKLFEPLFSTKTKGTGLGLVVCQNIIKGHKGRIEVESALGKGSVFTVKLLVK